MAFVNEYIPKEDFEKYNINAIDRQAPGTVVSARDWTVDRARNIYLRQTSGPDRDDPSTWTSSWWSFYWKGELLWLKREALGITEEADGLRHAHVRITDFNIPERLAAHEEEIRQDLREAFNAYGGGGVFSRSSNTYIHYLEFAD